MNENAQTVGSASKAPRPSGLLSLRHQPFDNTRDTRYFFASSGHAEAISRLEFLVEDRNMGMGMLTGEIGCGKTITRTVLHKKLVNDRQVVVSIENCILSFDDLLLEMLSQIRQERVHPSDLGDRYSRIVAFKQALTRYVVEKNRHLVIMLDEAQQLSPQDLEAVKALTNITAERRNFLTIILIGQPELRANIKALPQVDQRISLRYHLNPLSPREMVHYLMHRLRTAGLQGPPPFTREAIERLSEVSRGIPRTINHICKLALDHAIAHQLEYLDSRVIRAVSTDLARHGGLLDPCDIPS